MKNFKLMQIIPSLESGGAEQGTLDVANYLAEKGIKNYIISNGGRMLPYLNKKNIEHFILPVHSKNFIGMPLVAKKINQIILNKKINVLHVRSRAPAWLLPYINKKKLKSVSTFHNVYGTQNIFKKIYNKRLSKVDHIVAISKYVKNQIVEKYKINSNKIQVINRGTDVNHFNPRNNNQTEFANFLNNKNILLDKKIILFPGRLTDWKGQINFLNIVEHFKSDPIIFYFVGDDKNTSYRDKFLNIIRKKNLDKTCRILGHMNKNDLKMMYHCSDIVISAPSKPEGFGRIVSESLAMQKIILAYNFGGVENQLEGLDSLYKIKPYDYDELIEKINNVMNLSKNQIEKLGLIARQHVISKYSRDKMLQKYYDFYEGILN